MRSHVSAFDVAVLGAGAAGMMCAAEAGRRGLRVLLLDNGARPGRKILISGGGRCNFTNTGTCAENFLSGNPHFAKSALARFTPVDMVALVEKHGIRYHEKTLGQLFCNDSARQIVTMLERECGEAGVEIRCGTRVAELRRADAGSTSGFRSRFVVHTSTGDFAAGAVVVATGGLSIPKLDATGTGYDIARVFGHSVIEPRAALVPLVLDTQDRERWCDLTGVSTEVTAGVRAEHRKQRGGKGRVAAAPQFREKLLVTHRGVSGPAVLQVSSYWKPGEAVEFDLAPGRRVLGPMLAQSARRDAPGLLALLRGVLPGRLAERWVSLQLARGEDWTNIGIAALEDALHGWTLCPSGTEGFGKAEVTAGGVNTDELDAHTMESRRIPGLYFIGEVVDVTGWLGGYNFQWAWASAVAAGQALAER